MSNYFVIKLSTGDTVYARVEAKQPEGKMVIVEDPLIWEEFFTEDGYSASTLVRYCSGSDEREVPISRNAIVSMAAMSPDFSAFYEAAVGMTDMTADIYKHKLQDMTHSMMNKLSAYHAQKVQRETGDLVSFPLFGIPKSDKDTIH
jgi:hypothetical protein